MTNNWTKYVLLDEEGFAYHSSQELYVNYGKRKLISRAAVEARNMEWLRECISEDGIVGEWQFYFDTVLNDEEMKDILKRIAPSHASPA